LSIWHTLSVYKPNRNWALVKKKATKYIKKKNEEDEQSQELSVKFTYMRLNFKHKILVVILNNHIDLDREDLLYMMNVFFDVYENVEPNK